MGKIFEIRGHGQDVSATWHKAIQSNDDEQERYEEIGHPFFCSRPKALKSSSAFANNIGSSKKTCTIFTTNLSALVFINDGDFVKMTVDGSPLTWQIADITVNEAGTNCTLTLRM